MPYPNEHSARLKDPGQFDKFARKNDAGGKGVDFIFGIKDGKSEVQAIRFDKSKFTPAEAKDWLKRNKKKATEFEPASGEDKKDHMSVTSAQVPIAANPSEPAKKEFSRKLEIKNIVSDLHPEHIEDEDPVLGLDDSEREMWVEAFEAGEQTDSYGRVNTWTSEDIRDIAKRYNESKSKDPKPVVLGHPKENTAAPAMGWIEFAKEKGGKLLLKIGELNKDFVAALKSGAYKTRSTSLKETPEGDTINHLGFLGANAPAIKGLMPLNFNTEPNERLFTFDFNQETDMSETPEILDVNAMEKELTWYRKLMNAFKIDTKNFSHEDIVDKETGNQPETETPAEEKAEPKDAEHEETVERETKLVTAKDPSIAVGKEAQAEVKDKANEAMNENEELKNLVEELTKKVKALEDAIEVKDKVVATETQKADNRYFCEQLVRDGKLRPADFDKELENIENKQYIDSLREFSENPTHLVSDYRAELETRPKVVEFAEVATPKTVANDALVPVPGAENIDKYISKFIEDKMKQNPNISYGDAMTEAYNSIDDNKKTEWAKAYCGK